MRPQNKHLKPYKKGETGNPKGSKRGPRLKTILKGILSLQGDDRVAKQEELLRDILKSKDWKAKGWVLERVWPERFKEHTAAEIDNTHVFEVAEMEKPVEKEDDGDSQGDTPTEAG